VQVRGSRPLPCPLGAYAHSGSHVDTHWVFSSTRHRQEDARVGFNIPHRKLVSYDTYVHLLNMKSDIKVPSKYALYTSIPSDLEVHMEHTQRLQKLGFTS
jgi:hypothetical protein